ncbi:MAG TPA: hypothetical protein V6D29_13625 [Leptolyngbyaceae cyanobacterium]
MPIFGGKKNGNGAGNGLAAEEVRSLVAGMLPQGTFDSDSQLVTFLIPQAAVEVGAAAVDGSNITASGNWRSILGLKSAALLDSTAFATSAQGLLAQSAVQPQSLGTAAYLPATSFAGASGSNVDIAAWRALLGVDQSTNASGALVDASNIDVSKWRTAIGLGSAAFVDASTLVLSNSLASVALTASYNDLIDLPTIPSTPGQVGAAAVDGSNVSGATWRTALGLGSLATLNSVTVGWADVGGGILSAAQNSSGVNATVPVLQLTPGGTATNIDIALTPKGSGAILAHVPDNGMAGGDKRGANSVDLQTIRFGGGKVASGIGAALVGGNNNSASGNYSSVLAGRDSNASGNICTILGGQNHTASGSGCVIAGGYNDAVTSSYAGILAGQGNSVAGSHCTILAGEGNTINDIASHSGIVGGQGNNVLGGATAAVYSGILAGYGNNISTGYSGVVAGNSNNIAGQYAVIAGGQSNTITNNGGHSFIGGSQSTNLSASNSAVIGGSGHNCSGNRSGILAGQNNTVSGQYAVSAGGNTCTASGSGGFTGGGASLTASGSNAAAFGHSCIANGNQSLVSGYQATARLLVGCRTHSSGAFGVPGDAQEGTYQSRALSTSASPVVLTFQGVGASTTSQLVTGNNSSVNFRIQCIAQRTDVIGEYAAINFDGLITRGANAASTVLQAVVKTPIFKSISAWDFNIAADTTNGGLSVTFTGEAGKTIRAVCVIRTVEVTS